jgi:hypothetical protein
MGFLEDIMDADGELLVDTDAFGETVTYNPLGGDAASLKAVVFRNPPQQVNGSFTAASPYIEVWIRNHATYGRTSINTGGDTITVAAREGGATANHPVDSILQQGGGMWKLRLR